MLSKRSKEAFSWVRFSLLNEKPPGMFMRPPPMGPVQVFDVDKVNDEIVNCIADKDPEYWHPKEEPGTKPTNVEVVLPLHRKRRRS